MNHELGSSETKSIIDNTAVLPKDINWGDTLTWEELDDIAVKIALSVLGVKLNDRIRDFFKNSRSDLVKLSPESQYHHIAMAALQNTLKYCYKIDEEDVV